MNLFVLLFSLLIAIPLVASADNGPFGLSWGATEKELRDQGVHLNFSNQRDRFKVFTANTLPKDLSLAEEYVLFIDKDFYLQKVVVASTEIDGDVSGSEGKALYADIKSKLIRKYGEPSLDYAEFGLVLFSEFDEFYQCLAYNGCGLWVSVFDDKYNGATIGLQLKGISRGKGIIMITYEGPKWSDALKARDSTLSKSDADAL